MGLAKEFKPNNLTAEIYRLHPEIKWLDNSEYRRIKWQVENKGLSVSAATVLITGERDRVKYRAVPLQEAS